MLTELLNYERISKKQYSEEEQLPSEEVIRMAACKSSLIAFIEEAWHIVEPKTPFKAGWHLDAICDHLQAVSNNQIQNLLINIPPRHMKLCSDNTPVLTPKGWTTHGDLNIGDEVFSPKGIPIKIVNKTKKDVADMEVEFRDGTIIKCNGEHLWTVYDRIGGRKWRTVDTDYLFERESKRKDKKIRSNFNVPRIDCMEFESKDLPIHPYFLGAWLGDGSNTKPCLYHKHDIKHIEYLNEIGYTVTNKFVHPDTKVITSYFGEQNIIQNIRKLNLYNNKHIPEIYKFSSVEQRLQLLAGFIDTDGYVDPSGRIKLCNCNKTLINDLKEVCTTLGFYPYIGSYDSSGKEFPNSYKTNSIYYQVGFYPSIEIPTKLNRKKAKAVNSQKRRIGIKSITKSKIPEQGNCITVDSEDGLYLVGKKLIPTHNSLAVSVFFTPWEWITNPSLRYVYSSYAQNLSKRDSRKSRAVIQSLWYQARWGSLYYLSSDQNEKLRFENDKTGMRLATSVGGLGTGEGGDRIIVDDPHNVVEGESPIKRESVIDWWDDGMSTRLNDEDTGAKIIIMQRIHQNDLSGHVIAEEHGYDHLCLPARYEGKNRIMSCLNWTDKRTEIDEALWPAKFGEKQLKKREKKMSTYAIAGQHQQNPAPRGGGLFKTEMFRIEETFNRNHIVSSMRYWDKAGSKDTGKMTAGVLMHRMKDNTMVIEHVKRGQWEAPERNRHMKQTAKIDGKKVRIRHEQEGGSGGKESAQITNKDFIGYLVKADHPTGSKEVRAEAFATHVSNGNVILIKDAGWSTRDYIEECEMFPSGTYSDQVDASSGCFNLMLGVKAKAGTWGKR